ncbi:MAG: hypothetical protein U1F35_05240 [Steroidobacteraceae bacterium]
MSSLQPGDLVEYIGQNLISTLFFGVTAGARGTVIKDLGPCPSHEGQHHYICEFGGREIPACGCTLRKLPRDTEGRKTVSWDDVPWQPAKRTEAA